MADKAHEQTDEMLADMEKHLSAIYKRAEKEIQEKADDYFKRFSDADKKKRKQVEAGKLSEKDYQKWRKSKLIYGKRFTEMKEQIAGQILNVNKTAMAYVNGELPEVYALNYNALEPDVEGVGGYSFTLTDADTVKNLASKDMQLLPYKKIDPSKDIPWNMKRLQSEILQGILQGESIPKIAARVQNVSGGNLSAAIRNARTMVTGAECRGRQDSYVRAERDGIQLERKWISTSDGRTRDWHRELDGKTAKVDEPFENSVGKIMFPGDPAADPANVYN